jgi:hypothetical protein
VQTSLLAEAQDMVSHIRSAEDAFRSENGVTYLQVSHALGPSNDYPAQSPGAFKTAWGAACTWCIASNVWQQLAVQPNGPVAYGYSVLVGPTGSETPPTAINGNNVALSALQGAPWYVIEADGDYFGTGSYTTVYATSGNNHLFLLNGTQ